MPDSTLTAEEIAQVIGITARAVQKRSGIAQYECGTASRGGRPSRLFRAEALQLWGPPATTTARQLAAARQLASRHRQQRADWGLPRNCTFEQWGALVASVRGFYVASAQPNLKLACEHAAAADSRNGFQWPLSAQQVYRRLSRKDLAPDGLPISELLRDGWEDIRRSALRKKDIALEIATSRYCWPEIFENAGWAGHGFGALRVWCIDVRSADAWANNTQGKAILPLAIYIRCGLTQYPLWVEPIEGETSTAIIRAVLKCMIAWRRSPDMAYVIDNGKAMIAERTLEVLKHTLPYEAFERAREYPEIFGANGSPILRNLPNIPRSPFKAALERSFKLIKDEYDATRHPHSYQGGNRSEAVQLRISSQPVYTYAPHVLQSVGKYFGGMAEWLYTDHVHRQRPAMFPTFTQRGITPSIAAVFEYYYDPLPAMPDGERLAYILYWATERRAVVKAGLGYVDATINGRLWHCVSPALDHHLHGQKIAVLPIPDSDHAVLMLANDPSRPRYLATAPNAMFRSIAQIREHGPAVGNAQRAIRAELRRQREATPARAWANTHPTTTPQPQLPAAAAAWIDGGEELEVEELEVEELEVVEELAGQPPPAYDAANAEAMAEARQLLG